MDPSAALARVGGDGDLLRETAALFLVEAPSLMAAIRAAVAGGEAERLARAAHTLKVSAAPFGAAPVGRAASRLEALGRTGELGALPEARAALETGLARLSPALGEVLGRSPQA